MKKKRNKPLRGSRQTTLPRADSHRRALRAKWLVSAKKVRLIITCAGQTKRCLQEMLVLGRDGK